MVISHQLYIAAQITMIVGLSKCANISLIKHFLKLTTYKCLKPAFTMVKTFNTIPKSLKI